MSSPIQKVELFLDKYKVSGKSVLCAVSGGCDSIFLLTSLFNLKDKFNLKIYAVHIDHGLRPSEGLKEKTLVEDIAKEMGITFEFKRLEGKKNGDSGIEEWARNERYSFYEEVKDKHEIDFIATGHTFNDQSETVFMRIGRGAGIKGLSGISPFRDDGLIRPLLSIKKSEIIEYLRKNKIDWLEDSSNETSLYTRNRVRNDFLPQISELYPTFEVNLFDFSEQMRDLKEILAPPVNIWCISHIGEHDNREFSISKPLDLENRLIASEGMANIFREYGLSLERSHIMAFLDNCLRTSGEFLLPGGWRYYPGKDKVHITSKGSESLLVERTELRIPGETLVDSNKMISIKSVNEPDLPLKKERSGDFVALDRSKIGEKLFIRSVHKEDHFQPLGMDHDKNLYKYLKKRGLNSHEREQALLVHDDQGMVVWIPGINISEKCKIDESTSSFLELKITIS